MIHAGKALVAAGLAVMLSTSGAARAQESGSSEAAPDGANIVNGIPSHLQPTTGALLFVGPDLKNQFLDCSGVLIGCRTVLTAAHCLCKTTDNAADCLSKDVPNLDVADLRFFLQHSGFHHVRDVYINPDYVRGLKGDLAVLRLSELVTGIEPALFHQSYPTQIPHGSEGIIAGFGNSGDSATDAAIKRVGAVSTDDCPVGSGVTEPSNICWNYTAPISKPGDESSLCLHDDGGPLFIDFGKGPEVAGIHAGSGDTCEADSFSYDTNVVRSKEWIQSVGGLDITRDQCSEFAEVGEPWVTVQGGEGRLPKDQDEARFSFTVPKDALFIRVTVNGDTVNNGDYDMFVGLGSTMPTKFVNDCKSRGVGQFGSCSFDAPKTGAVNVLIRHVKPNVGRGRSRFQVTVSAWQTKPPEEDPPRGPDDLRYEKRAPGFRKLYWTDDSDNEKGFEVQRRSGTDPFHPFVTQRKIAADKTTFLDEIPDDQTFSYRVRAFNDWGNSEWSNICVVNFPRIKRPTRLHAETVAAGAVTLRWKDNSDSESYMELQRRPAGSLKWRTVKTLPADTRDYVDHGVEAGKSYEYRVRARGYLDQCIQHSLWSNRLSVTTPAQ